MGYVGNLTRYKKGDIKSFDSFQDVAENVNESGDGALLSYHGVFSAWLEDTLDSIKVYHKRNGNRYSGAEEYIMYLVTKEEFDRLLSEGKDVLLHKEAIDKAIDQAVGDNTVYGRSDLG